MTLTARFRPIDRDSAYLFLPSVQDWLVEYHLVRYIANVVENVDLSAIERAYGGSCTSANRTGSVPAFQLSCPLPLVSVVRMQEPGVRVNCVPSSAS